MSLTNNLQNPGAELVERFRKASEQGIVLDPRAVAEVLYLPLGIVVASFNDAGQMLCNGEPTNFIDYFQALVNTEGVTLKEVERIPLTLVRRSLSYQGILAHPELSNDPRRGMTALSRYVHRLNELGFDVDSLEEVVPKEALDNVLRNPRYLEAVLEHSDILIPCCMGVNTDKKGDNLHLDGVPHYRLGNKWVDTIHPVEFLFHQKIGNYVKRKDAEGKSVLSHGMCPSCLDLMYPGMGER